MIKQELVDEQAYCIEKATAHILGALRDGKKGPSALFESLWNEILDDKTAMRSLASLRYVPFSVLRLNLAERLHFLCVSILRRHRVSYLPSLRVHGKEALAAALASKHNSTFVSVHHGNAFMLQLLHQLKQKTSLISSYPFIGDILWKNGLTPDKVTLISKDIRSLGRLKKTTKEGIISANCVDYQAADTTFSLINPNIFDFAARQGIDVYMFARQIDRSGHVHLFIEALEPSGDPIRDAGKLVELERSEVYAPGRTYTVRALV